MTSREAIRALASTPGWDPRIPVPVREQIVADAIARHAARIITLAERQAREIVAQAKATARWIQDEAARADLVAQVVELAWTGDLSQREIAERLGIGQSTVSRVLAEARHDGASVSTLSRADAARVAANARWSKDADARAAKASEALTLTERGLSTREIAERLGIGQSTTCRYVAEGRAIGAAS